VTGRGRQNAARAKVPRVSAKQRGEFHPRKFVTWFRRAIQPDSISVHCARSMHVPSTEPAYSSPERGGRKCCYAWDASSPCALGWRHRRKPPGTPDWFTAPPVPSCVSTSQNSRPPPPRCGREATAPPTPRSRRHGNVSRARRPNARRLLVGLRGKFGGGRAANQN
jgi:hypothetical protein